MVTVETLNSKIWNIEQKILEIIVEYNTHGSVTISLKQEGPCLRTNNFYTVLDNICDSLKFKKSNITIVTSNLEEQHNEYNIQIGDSPWFTWTHNSVMQHGYVADVFRNKKQIDKNLFGLFVGRPNWNRLCLLSHLKFNTNHLSLISCNGSWNPDDYNIIQFDDVIKYSPSELENIQKFVKLNPIKLPNAEFDKENFHENVLALSHYNSFFIEIVCETYTSGLTFFPTEKTIRPMYGLTPFVVFGPQGYLSNLKARYGFKTFDLWWSEDYDNYQNYDRVKAMYQIIDYLDRLSDAELQSMYSDMQDTLDHNHNRLMELYGK
jgi:hypothetical protein